ncbi:MAG: hypothetical protein KVP17_002213 [Porospora cf. gigantea B]|uniref:uncharacterized protein n=1 Tax=Porospora cf. gigantea B TaxID=2853592 RepID=UPI003571BA85|nr:MAG: hypothetical protein KVP17_002213 [Porospora cf. gigantea B]
MATLVKLGIRGIRAFSPANLEVLTFQKPLTLIVGHNGAGKTTIVECLKMASCGELPPFANRGHNFVHDTKVADQAEVKAQIRLQLATMNRQYTLTRNFMVSSTRGRTGDVKTTFKALDSVCSTLDLKTNVKTSASYKCSDMDKHAPSLLGLSKALIENVIFVHQEDSNWPLSDQATLKKKFDEVFGSTRYTKALEAINSHMKEFSKLSKEALHQLELAENVLGQARSLERRIGEIHAEAEQLRQQKQSWQTQLALFEGDLASNAETLKALGDVESVLSFKTHLLDEKKSQYTTLVSTMKEDFQESGEELLQLKAELEVEVEQCHGKEDECTRRIAGLEAKRDELAYKAREAERERRVAILNKERRDDAVRERNAILLKLEIVVVKDVNVVEQVVAMRHKLELSLGQAKEKARVALHSKSDECRRCRADLQTVEVRRRCLENDRDASIRKRGQLQTNVTRLRQVKQELLEIGQQAKYDAQVDDKVVEELQSRLFSLREERSVVEEELREANVSLRAAEGVAAVRHGLKVLVESKSRLAETLRETYQRVQNALGEPPDENWTPKRVDFDLVAAHRSQLDAERSSLALQADQANKCIGALDSQIADVRKRITDYQRRAAELTPPEGVSNPESLASLIAEKRQAEESCLRNVLVNQNAERMFSSFMAHSVKKHKCAFCTRPFRKDAEVEAMKSHLESRITSLPTLINEMEAELAVVRGEIQRLDACGPVVAELFDMQNALPTLKTTLKEAELKRKRQMELLPSCIARLDALQSKVNSVDTALGEGKSFARTWQQYEATCRDVLQVESQLIDSPSPTASRSRVGDLEDRLDAIPLKQVRTELEDALSARRSLEEQQHTLEMRRARLEQEQDSLRDSETELTRLPLDETGELGQVLAQEAKLSNDVSEADAAVEKCQEAFKWAIRGPDTAMWKPSMPRKRPCWITPLRKSDSSTIAYLSAKRST